MEQITEDELLDLVVLLGDNQEQSETRISQLEEKVRHLDKMTIKKRPCVVEQNGENLIVIPEDGDVFVRIFYTIDFSTRTDPKHVQFDSIRKCMNTLSNVIGTWRTKPGFHIISPINACQMPMGTLYSVIIGVDKTHISQEDL